MTVESEKVEILTCCEQSVDFAKQQGPAQQGVTLPHMLQSHDLQRAFTTL